MKLELGLVLSTLLSAARASYDAEALLISSLNRPSTSMPALSPAEARFVFAHRLGVAQYHELTAVDEKALKHISDFGGFSRWSLDEVEEPAAAELVLFIEGLSSTDGQQVLPKGVSTQTAFTIKDIPSTTATGKLVEDLSRQAGLLKTCPVSQAINPFDEECWGRSKSNVLHLNMSNKSKDVTTIDQLRAIVARIERFAEKGEMNTMLVLIPEAPKTSRHSYGSYDMPGSKQAHKRAVSEAPLFYQARPSSEHKDVIAARVSSNASELVRGVIPACFSSLDACITGTKNCSSHGQCGRKFKSDDATACFTCACSATTDYDDDGKVIDITHWGGGACQKKDISAPFWLITISTVVLVGIVSWGIGMLFSIGEEGLPGVIGAGVSSKAR